MSSRPSRYPDGVKVQTTRRQPDGTSTPRSTPRTATGFAADLTLHELSRQQIAILEGQNTVLELLKSRVAAT